MNFYLSKKRILIFILLFIGTISNAEIKYIDITPTISQLKKLKSFKDNTNFWIKQGAKLGNVENPYEQEEMYILGLSDNSIMYSIGNPGNASFQTKILNFKNQKIIWNQQTFCKKNLSCSFESIAFNESTTFEEYIKIFKKDLLKLMKEYKINNESFPQLVKTNKIKLSRKKNKITISGELNNKKINYLLIDREYDGTLVESLVIGSLFYQPSFSALIVLEIHSYDTIPYFALNKIIVISGNNRNVKMIDSSPTSFDEIYNYFIPNSENKLDNYEHFGYALAGKNNNYSEISNPARYIAYLKKYPPTPFLKKVPKN